jgi:hypothetical protein
MKKKELIILLALFLFSAAFVHDQQKYPASVSNKNSLIECYRQWKNSVKKQERGGRSTASSLYYPTRATNYNWSTLSSDWVFFDTTLYAYTGILVSSATRKDASNNFLTRTFTSYDTSENVIESLHQNWLSSWVNNYRDTFVFDSYNNRITQLNQNWNGSVWVTAVGANYINTYSGSGKILTQVTQNWNGTSWENVNRFTYTYNGNDQVIQDIRESWNSVALAWQNTSKYDYIYDVSNINTQTIKYSWSGSAWVNDTQIINAVWADWTGDISTSKPQSYTFQTWSGSTWVNSQRLLSATYDSNGGSIETFQQYVSSAWVNESRYSIFYDAQFNNTGKRDESWDLAFAVWDTVYEFRYLYTYDGNNSITQSIYQEYNVSSHAYQNYFRTDYSGFLLLNVSPVEAYENYSAQLFPNPLTEFSDVFVDSEHFNPVLYSVYDISGKKILSEKIQARSFRLYKKNLDAGIYFLMLSGSGGKFFSLKFGVQ